MKTIYLDNEYMCHIKNDGTMIEIQTEIFDNIPNEAVAYYRYIPEGKKWVDKNKRIFYGLFIQATDSEIINKIIQKTLFSDMISALNILGVTEE